MATVVIRGLTDGRIVPDKGLTNLRLPWQLERMGRWTRYTITPREIIFTEIDGRLRAILAFSIFAVATLAIASSVNAQFAAMTGVLWIVFAMACLRQWTVRYPKTFLISKEIGRTNCATVIAADDIDSILVRENVGRDETQDDRFVQLLIHVRGSGDWELLHQQYFRNYQRVILLAESLAEWLAGQ